MNKKLLIAGGTGLIGSAIRKEALRRGWEVTILSRRPGQGQIEWDPAREWIAIGEPMIFDAIINLAGASLAEGRWTTKRKHEISQSRMDAAKTLRKYLKDTLLRTSVYIGASAIGIYGDHSSEAVDESTPITNTQNWMIRTVMDWEAGHAAVAALDIRTVVFRIGLLLSREGGLLLPLLQTAPFGFIGYFGRGQQIWPWIHINDLVQMILMSVVDESVEGTYQASAPHPVSNKALAISASKQYSPRRWVLPVPAFILSIMLGRMHSMLLQSCNAYPSRLMQKGFAFRFQNIDEAMKDLIGKQ